MLERSRLIGFADSGNALGNIAALISSGYLCQKGQWSLIFYLFGNLLVKTICYLFQF